MERFVILKTITPQYTQNWGMILIISELFFYFSQIINLRSNLIADLGGGVRGVVGIDYGNGDGLYYTIKNYRFTTLDLPPAPVLLFGYMLTI